MKYTFGQALPLITRSIVPATLTASGVVVVGGGVVVVGGGVVEGGGGVVDGGGNVTFVTRNDVVLSVLLAVLMSYYLWVTVRASAETRESLL